MQLSIHKRNIQWSDALAGHAERRVHRGLDRVQRQVRRVLVRLHDLNGPRGGEDKRCAVAVRLESGHEIFVKARGACPYRTVDDAVDRLRRAMTRQLGRRRDRRRRG